MCGRIDVDEGIVQRAVLEHCQLSFDVSSNHDLRPTQTIEAVTHVNDSPQQLSTTWGIQPSWAKRILINAQAETVATKRTFQRAFDRHRCIVPCSGWYEWRQEEGQSKKTKYRFSHANGDGFFMAGIYYPSDDGVTRIVTLTTAPTAQCEPYHSRMPLLIRPEEISFWLASQSEALTPLLVAPENIPIKIKAA